MDYFTISYSSTNRTLFLVKKLGSYYSGSSYHIFGKLRIKHYLKNSYTVHLLRLPQYIIYGCSVDSTWITNNRITNYYGTTSIERLDVESRTTGSLSWHYISAYMGTPQNMALYDSDAADMVVILKFTAGYTYSSFYSTTHCNI